MLGLYTICNMFDLKFDTMKAFFCLSNIWLGSYSKQLFGVRFYLCSIPRPIEHCDCSSGIALEINAILYS